MTELLFVVCLATAPLTCEERALVFAGMTPNACLFTAQAHLARWSTRNPGYHIDRWKCRWAHLGERKT